MEGNKELIRRYRREVFDEGDEDAVDRYLAPDFYNHVTGRSGTADFKRLARELRGKRHRALVAEGAFVVALMTVTRTVDGELRAFGFTIPARGQSYTVTHVHIDRIADQKIREHWAARDDLGMLRQLEAIA